MKLRIFKNSVRLRLRQDDVRQFASTGLVEASVYFGGDGILEYRLVSSPDATAPTATFRHGTVEVTVPENMARHWTESEEVAISADQSTGLGERLAILIEKDFQCMHTEDESDAGTYPNPMLTT